VRALIFDLDESLDSLVELGIQGIAP